MRRSRLPVILLAAACQSNSAPGPTTLQNPRVPVAVLLPPGTRLRAELAPGTPDEPSWRTAAVWWREALRQTVSFEITDSRGTAPIPALQLSIDPASHALAAHLLAERREQPLAGESFADGDLAGAIDRLAWATRLALGEPAVAPIPIAKATSAVPKAVLAVEDAMALLRDGALNGAHQALLDARREDGGAPFVLDGLAAVELLRSNAEAAVRLCLEALSYAARLHPTTQHRLARTLLLARASMHPLDARQHDRELLALAEAGQRERPHDPQPALSLAIASNFLGDFAAARPLLEALRERLPDQAIVDYHLGWACLATGDAASAVVHFETAALRLPSAWLVLPRAIALFEAGQHDELQALLQQLLAEIPANDAAASHQVRRMQAAHALLRGDLDAAVDRLLEDFSELLKSPTVLEGRAGEFAEQGAVLVRLGGGSRLPPLLTAIQHQHPASQVADACSFLQGLVQVSERREQAPDLQARLARDGESVWAVLLKAFAHEMSGEVADMNTALLRASGLSSSPMTKALLARSLRAMGNVTEADALRTALRREMTAIDLRAKPQHPLLGPELAFAWRAE
ncbi:MAG: hypothetical protein ABIP94_13045 [Planctomycetota bacterium]